MKFINKISGTAVEDFDIQTIFNSQVVSLKDAMKKLKRQESMNYLLDNFRFSLCKDGEWRAVIAYDDDYKFGVLEHHPEYEKELKEYFGENWLNHYIRFGH